MKSRIGIDTWGFFTGSQQVKMGFAHCPSFRLGDTLSQNQRVQIHSISCNQPTSSEIELRSGRHIP